LSTTIGGTLYFYALTKIQRIQSVGYSFEMAKAVTLVHPDATLKVPARQIVSKCDLFVDDPGLAAVPYELKSEVCVSDFREFVSALEATTMKVTNNNFKGVLRLCEEFRFQDVAA
jgi:hypothetical protein